MCLHARCQGELTGKTRGARGSAGLRLNGDAADGIDESHPVEWLVPEGAPRPNRLNTSNLHAELRLSDEIVEHMTMNVRQSEITARIAIGELFMVEA